MATVRGASVDPTVSKPSTPKRTSAAYPSHLARTGPSPFSHATANRVSSKEPSRPDAPSAHQYQSLEQLLAQAGYTETRVITPEAVRIKERVQRLWAEDAEAEARKKQGVEHDEVETPLSKEESGDSRNNPAERNTQRAKLDPRDGSFGGWSIGRAQGARMLEEAAIRSKPALRSRASALGLTFAIDDNTSVSHTHSHQTINASSHAPEDDCDSLSSASSTASSESTVIASPPEFAAETFVRVQSESPPDHVRDMVFPASDPYARMLSGSYRGGQSSPRRSGSGEQPSAPQSIPQQSAKQPDVDLAQSAAAKSLRKIASQATLRQQPSLTSTSTRTVRPKNSLAQMHAARPPVSPVPEVPTTTTTTVRKVLRHAASTPFLRSSTATISTFSDVKGKAPEGWFASFSRFAFARSTTEPVSPPLRSRPSIPSFQSNMGSSCLRGAPIPATVTRHSVTCVSDEGDDLPPFAAMFKTPYSDDDDVEDTAPRTPPVLLPRVEYGENEAWRFGGVWFGSSSGSASLAMSITTPDTATSSPPSSPPPLRPLKAQRSIKSLRAALAAHDPPPPVPALPSAHVRLPIFAISSPDTLERGLPPRTLDLSDEAILRMGKGRWNVAAESSACEEDDAGGSVEDDAQRRACRDADVRGRPKSKGSVRKGGRR